MGAAGSCDARQEAVRDAWRRGGVRRSEKKSVQIGWELVSLGKELNGREGWQGPTLERLGELLGMGMWMLSSDRLSGRVLRVGLGGLVNVVLERRPLFAVLGQIFHELDEEVEVPLAEEAPWAALRTKQYRKTIGGGSVRRKGRGTGLT